MPWTAERVTELHATCEDCGHQLRLVDAAKTDAIVSARERGWFIDATAGNTKALCPAHAHLARPAPCGEKTITNLIMETRTA
jgi:hypothetical protein